MWRGLGVGVEGWLEWGVGLGGVRGIYLKSDGECKQGVRKGNKG